MKSLSETITRLSAFRAKPVLSSEGQTRLSDLTNFGPNPGSLRSRVYIPEKLPAKAPLVVVLHGCTQTAASYDYGSGWSRLADEQGFALLFPQQQRSNNSNLCFNWFVPDDIRRGQGEALSISQMIETFIVAHDLDRRRIFITGLSAGGAMTSVMLATYPEVFAGGAIIAGLPFGGAITIPEAFERMRGQDLRSKLRLQSLVRDASPHTGPWPTVSVWHGSADGTVDLSNAEAIVDQWREVQGLGKTPSSTEIVDGHRRRFWRDAKGKVLIEEYIIAGMGHGIPLNTGEAGLGNGGAFMLDVGISSTRHIARFWGLVKPGIAGKVIRAKANAEAPMFENRQEGVVAKAAKFGKPLPVPPRPMAQEKIPPAASDRLQTVIESALRKAGLMS